MESQIASTRLNLSLPVSYDLPLKPTKINNDALFPFPYVSNSRHAAVPRYQVGNASEYGAAGGDR